MKYNHFEVENITSEVRQNIQDKFRLKYTQDDLSNLWLYLLPAFVRWNNRNVYGTVYFNGVSFAVNQFYRLKRDGTPVRMYVDFVSD